MALLETAAALVILYSAGRALVALIATRGQARLHIRHDFGRRLLLGLDFAIAADVLRISIVPNLEAVLVAGLVVLVRAALTLLLEWEVRNEERQEEMHERHSMRTGSS